MLLLWPVTGWPETEQNLHQKNSFRYPDVIQRYYLNFSIDGYSIVLKGSPQQVEKLTLWLNQITRIPEGRKTLRLISNSGNQLLIRHSTSALIASGRTMAPLTRKLTNHQGDNTEILFDTRIPNSGSHLVFDKNQNTIKFTAIQNLYHELVHAKHLMNGTFRYYDVEGQAIEEENFFRIQQSELKGNDQHQLRVGIKGQQLWWPDTDKETVAAGNAEINTNKLTQKE